MKENTFSVHLQNNLNQPESPVIRRPEFVQMRSKSQNLIVMKKYFMNFFSPRKIVKFDEGRT